MLCVHFSEIAVSSSSSKQTTATRYDVLDKAVWKRYAVRVAFLITCSYLYFSTVFNCSQFSQRSSVTDAYQGPKFTSASCQTIKACGLKLCTSLVILNRCSGFLADLFTSITTFVTYFTTFEIFEGTYLGTFWTVLKNWTYQTFFIEFFLYYSREWQFVRYYTAHAPQNSRRIFLIYPLGVYKNF